MKRNSTELKVKYHGNKTEKSKGRKKNPNVADISKQGYRDDSPYRSMPSIDIHTPSGIIDMSGTGIPLWANGQLLQPYSGQHFIGAETVKEIPAEQTALAEKGTQVNSAIPVIDDAGSMVDGMVWVPDWKKMAEQAKKLGAKKVKTKNGAIINFDDNWEVVSVDDNPGYKTGGTTNWLDQYQTKGEVDNDRYPEVQQLPTIDITATMPEHIRDQQKSQFIQNLGNLNTALGYEMTANDVFRQGLYGVGPYALEKSNQAPDYDPPILSENDALRIYLGLNQRYGSFMPSKYEKGAYDFAEGYQKLFPDKFPKDEEKINEYIRSAETHPKHMDENPLKPYDDFVMGRHQLKKGSDKKGDYIEYYDEWDLDTQGMAGVLADKTIGTPFNIRGRVYYDKKTGKRMDEYAPKYEPEIKYKKTGGSKLPTHLPEAYKMGGNWLDNYQSGGPTVRELWESATGKPWSAAKESGLTTGTYADNKALKKRIMAGEFGKMKASTPAPAAVAPAKGVRPASPLYMQALNQSNRQAGARDASSTLGEQQRRAANILVSEGKVKPTKRDDTKAAPEGSVRSYVQKGVDYLEKMAKLSSAMNTSGTGWATDLGTSFITVPVQSGLNISNTVMGDRPIRNDSDILDLGIDVANVLPFATEAAPILKNGITYVPRKLAFHGVDPVNYNVGKKIKEFVPTLYKNVTDPAGRALRVGKKYEQVVGPLHYKTKERVGKNLLDSWATGLQLKQKYNTLTPTGENLYSITNFKRNPDLFKQLHREINLNKRGSPKQLNVVEKARDPNFQYSVYDIDEANALMGNYRWDVKKNQDGLLHFRSDDVFDLHPFKKSASIYKDENRITKKGLFDDFEALSAIGGKPFRVQNNFLVDPKTYKVVKQWKQGGTMKNWLDKYQGNVKKSQTGNARPLIIGTDQYESILKPTPERDWRSTASDIYEAVLDPVTYAGAGLDYASDWVKQQMGMKPEGELDPIRTRAMRQQAKGTATNVPAQVWQVYNKPLWLGNLVDQSVMYGKTGDINEFQPALQGIAAGLGAKATGLKLKQMGGGSDDESFGPVRKAGMPSVEAGESMPEVTRTQETESFGEAFKKARAAGLKTFTWRGKTFGTKYKTEVEQEQKTQQKKQPAKTEQPVAKKPSAPLKPLVDFSLKNVPISSKPKTTTQPVRQAAPVQKARVNYPTPGYSVTVTNPSGSRVTDRVAPTAAVQAQPSMGRMPAGNISYGYQTAPASTTEVARPMIGPGMQPVGKAPKTLPVKSTKPVAAQLQNQQPENVAADVRDFQNNLMGSILSKLNQRGNVPMAPGRFQVGADPRQLPQTGIITDKRTNQQYVKTPSGIYNYPVLTAKNPDLNANPYSVEYLEEHPELRNLPRGYYTLEDAKMFDGTSYAIDPSDDEGNLGRWLNPINAFQMPAPIATYNAMHGTYMPEYKKRNPLYTQSPEKRWVSFGCVNARECDLKKTFDDIAVGDTSVVLDSKFPEDAILLEQIKREQRQYQPLVSQGVRRKKGGSAKDWLKNYQ